MAQDGAKRCLYALCLTNGTRLGLVTKRIDDFRAWADEREASLLDFAREFGILREETVAVQTICQLIPAFVATGHHCAPRVDHVDAMLQRDSDDVVLCEISPDGGEALADLVRFVRLGGLASASIHPFSPPARGRDAKNTF